MKLLFLTILMLVFSFSIYGESKPTTKKNYSIDKDAIFLQKTISFCKEKSNRLCIRGIKRIFKKNPKTIHRRELTMYKGVAEFNLYRKYNTVKILKIFLNDNKNDNIKRKAILYYLKAYKYQYGIYYKKHKEHIISVIDKNKILFSGETRKEIMEFLFSIFQTSYGKNYSEIEKLLSKNLKTKEERGRFYYQKAYNTYYYKNQKKGVSLFKIVVDEFPRTKYYYNSINLMVTYYNSKQNFIQSLRILRKAKKGLTVFHKQFYNISNKIAQITNQQLTLYVNYTFLPNNKPFINLNWRNSSSITLKLYKVNNINRYIKPGYNFSIKNITGIKSEDKTIIKTWNKKLINNKKYIYHSETIKLDILKSGIYILEGTTKLGKKYQTTINVTRSAVVVKASPDRSFIYVADSITGKPIPDAEVFVNIYRYNYKMRKNINKLIKGKTDDSGVFSLKIPDFDKKRYYAPTINVTAIKDGSVSFSSGYSGYYYWNYYKQYSAYSYTDRPAYRPGEEIHYKAFIRESKDGGYTIPKEKFHILIMDTKGKKVVDKDISLNEYGTINGSFKTKKDAPLGQYSIYIMNSKKQYIYRSYGYFRVEEYKKPEFKMNISTKNPIYKPGDKIKIEIDTQYYFGGAVKGAKGEVLVYEQPYYHYFYFPRAYYWYYNNWQQNQNPYAAYGSYKGTFVKKYKIKTDKSGKAYIEVKTKSIKQIERELKKKYGQNYVNWLKNRNSYNNYNYGYYGYGRRRYRRYGYYNHYYWNYYYSYDRKYHLEVRLTDKSRREIVGNKDIKVTDNPFYIYTKPNKYVYTPKENINLTIKVMNANNEAVETEGTFTISQYKYNKKKKKYENKIVSSKGLFVKKMENNRFIHKFKIDKEGYYYVNYSVNYGKKVIKGGTYIYISNSNYAKLSVDKNISVIPDKDFYKPNEKAKVLITTQYPNSYVLLTIEGETLYKYQIEYVREGSKIVELQLDERMTPNVTIKAGLVTNLAYFEQQKEIIIPPMDKFITIKVERDKDTYKPGEEATFKVKTLDYKGNPVKAEVSVGITDASIYYIQPEYAKDILQFYYSKRKQMSVKTNNSFYNMRYYNNDKGVKLKQNIVEREKSKEDAVSESNKSESFGIGRGGGGGTLGRSSGSYGKSKISRSTKKRRSRRKRSPKASRRSLSDDLDNSFSTNNQVKKPNFDNVKIREKFASTAFWSPTIVTDSNGEATIKMKFPENLTEWRITARAINKKTHVGEVKNSVKTKKDILVRLQSPRFFLERDRVTLSGNIHNYSKEDGVFDIKLEVKGGLKPLDSNKYRKITLKAGEDKRVNFIFDVIEKGEATISLFAKSKMGSDAMLMHYPIKIYGSLKTVTDVSNTKDKTVSILNLPSDRVKSGTELEINVAPSVASIMIASLDYLAQYPYGCVEQTMSRFLPTVLALRATRELGFDKSFFKNKNIDDMINKGLKRLYDFQKYNGGWGWWRNDNFNQYMTAYVVYGLTMARNADVKVDQKRLNRGITALKNSLKYNKNRLSTETYALFALSFSKVTNNKILNKVYSNRGFLNSYSKALLAITMHNLGKNKKAKVLLRNLEDNIIIDKKNKTAHYGRRNYWYWYHGDVESTSFALRAYLLIDKNSVRVQQLLKWLIYNRTGNRWKHTKDTAHAVYALTDYLRVFKEVMKNGSVTVKLNGKKIQTIKFDRDSTVKNLNGWKLKFKDSDLKTGENRIEFIKNGKEDIYFSNFLTYFSQEEHIKADGHELTVKRTYRKIMGNGKNKKFKTLKEGDTIKSGDRIEVKLEIKAKNHYSYIMVDDFKPAGMEAVRLTSGSSHAGGTYANMEVRDDKTVFFISYLYQGKKIIKYELRAETPGLFHSMPTKINAMYVPQLKGNSDSTFFKIVE